MSSSDNLMLKSNTIEPNDNLEEKKNCLDSCEMNKVIMRCISVSCFIFFRWVARRELKIKKLQKVWKARKRQAT
jgi:hypothetical protein